MLQQQPIESSKKHYLNQQVKNDFKKYIIGHSFYCLKMEKLFICKKIHYI